MRLGDARRGRPGVDYDVVSTRPVNRADGGRWFPLSYDVDGRALTVLSEASDGESLPSQTLRVEDRTGHVEFRVPRLRQERSRQVVAGVLRGHVVVWKETESADLVQDQWSMYSFDPSTGRTQLIAAQRTATDRPNPVAPGGTTPSVAGDGRVYFSSVDTAHAHRPQVNVMSVPLDGTSGPVVETSGIAAVARKDFLFWVDESRGEFRVQRRNLRTNEEITLVDSGDAGCQRVTGLAANGAGAAAVALRCTDDDEVRVLGLGADAQETIAVRGEGLGYLSMGEDFVWFAQASSDGGYVQYLWRLSTGELTTVGQGLVSGEAVVGGDFLSWATFHGAAGTRTLAELAD